MFGGEDVAEPECDTCLMRAALAAVLSLPEGMTWHRAYNTTSSVPNIGDATVIQVFVRSVWALTGPHVHGVLSRAPDCIAAVHFLGTSPINDLDAPQTGRVPALVVVVVACQPIVHKYNMLNQSYTNTIC
eukprot:7705991-Pyramimonas_sp.AAC.2